MKPGDLLQVHPSSAYFGERWEDWKLGEVPGSLGLVLEVRDMQGMVYGEIETWLRVLVPGGTCWIAPGRVELIG